MTCRPFSYLLIALTAWMVLTPPFEPARAESSLFSDHKGIVAVDPGHGGRDSGAKAGETASEKTISLNLARRLTDLLEPAYRVVLTRGGDYDVGLTDRAAAANHQKADLLISLHVAAGFQRTASGTTLYYYQPAAKEAGQPARSMYRDSEPKPWQRLQIPHISESRRLANLLQQSIATVAGIQDVRVAQAPLALLQGADMPAVLIEVGHLSNPEDERRLASPEGQAAMARALMKGIESFLISNDQPSR